MPVTTTSAAVHIAPVVIKTFFKHGTKKAKRLRASKTHVEVAHDDIFFDEAFHIVKAFIKLGTKNTIESLQAFTNTHVPAPPWAAVSPVTIPLTTCNDAADALIEWFGPEEIKHVVGGERWWQVRGLDGVDAEWIAEDEDLDTDAEFETHDGKKLSDADANILRMERLDTVMLYVHGGGYFWGSINTHRYQILHYARKYKGRAFAVNYRKAPQYPWPCPLQDVVAAYLYLIRPPPEALHKPIPSSKIVFAGDSAGGGLCLTTLTIIRDLGLPMPAGAVLISPWVDLTHSFPSVMQNYDTDIIPKHGFLAKPSTLWPIPAKPENGGRVVPTVTNAPPKPGRPDTLKPSLSRVRQREEEVDVYGPGLAVKSQQEMLDDHSSPRPHTEETCEHDMQLPSPSGSEMTPSASNDEAKQPLEEYDIDNWEPKPPKVLMENPNAVPLELRSQIQMYASTELLTHPLVSPILQGSLGNLPPLYIIAGDGEVLRDEIIYLAHKAAHPAEYPTRAGVLRDTTRQKENAQNFTTPTKVHLQVFDGMCHVLTVFMFTKSAKYAYRSIGEFISHVSRYDEEHLHRNPFPELHRPPDEIYADNDMELDQRKKHSQKFRKEKNPEGDKYPKPDIEEISKTVDARRQESPPSDVELYLQNEQITIEEVKRNTTETTSSHETSSQFEKDIPAPLMIRERVDIDGKVRSMEPREALQALQLKSSQIGIIKEAPTLRWLDGQNEWDERYSKRTERIIKKRAKYETKAERLIQNALDEGFIHESCVHGQPDDDHTLSSDSTHMRMTSVGKIQAERRWGPLDLQNERPPATAIAARRDTAEAVALLKKCIYYTAPATHRTVPKLKTKQAIQAAFDPNDNPNKPPKQSVSEQQVQTRIIPIHGLRMWDNILRYFGRKTSPKVADKISATAEKIGIKSNGDER